nr:hypothetical protein [uncultured Mediterranean phage uvMED]
MSYITFQPKDYFNTKLYTGNNSSSQALTGVGFQPDWVWLKGRNVAESHRVYDAVRGVANNISSNSNAAQSSAIPLTSFDSDGFTIGSADGSVNGNYNYASWNWKANGAGSSNTDGSVTSTVSVSTTSGFSICKFDATGSTMTFGHGLGVKPAVMFVKRTDSNSNGNWIVYHKSIGATKFLTLNDTSAETTSSTRFGDTEPTSSVATVGSELLSGGTYIAYCFAQKSGFSSMGSYTGNGNADGTFVYTGFKPAFVLGKNTTVAGQHWFMNDNKRGINGGSNWLKADGSDAELTNLVNCDLLSNGFKLRNNNDIFNDSGETFIYMAFSEESIVSSNGIPAVAG